MGEEVADGQLLQVVTVAAQDLDGVFPDVPGDRIVKTEAPVLPQAERARGDECLGVAGDLKRSRGCHGHAGCRVGLAGCSLPDQVEGGGVDVEGSAMDRLVVLDGAVDERLKGRTEIGRDALSGGRRLTTQSKGGKGDERIKGKLVKTAGGGLIHGSSLWPDDDSGAQYRPACRASRPPLRRKRRDGAAKAKRIGGKNPRFQGRPPGLPAPCPGAIRVNPVR